MKEIKLEDLNLSVRSYNCLKRAGISTLEDIAQKLEPEGIAGLLSIRNLGYKSLEETLRKLMEKGYDVIPHLDKYLDSMNPDDGRPELWTNMKESLCSRSTTSDDFHKTSLYDLKGLNPTIARRMRTNRLQTILTVEDLLERFENEDSLMLPDSMKWLLLRALDKNGYRFKSCSKEQWGDIDEYIMFKRAQTVSVDSLDIPREISETLTNVGLTVSQIITKKHDFLLPYLSNYEIAILLQALDRKNLRVKNASQQDYANIADFIVAHIEIPIAEIGLSPRTTNNLIEHGILSLGALLKTNRQQLLEQHIVSVVTIGEIVKKLYKNHFHLSGDSFYLCDKCEERFVAPTDNETEHYCKGCAERMRRINRTQDLEVTTDGPEYSTYTDGSRGFTIYVTLHNKTKKVIPANLSEFMVYSRNRQWAASSFLTGYVFNSEHILPQSSKTVAKIWSGAAWKDYRLTEGDYVTIAFTIKDKIHSYKFVMREDRLELDDYHIF